MNDCELASAVAARLGNRTLACAESCTAGRLSQTFVEVDGAEAWFRGGVVAYQVPVKRSLLGVTELSVLGEAAVAQMAAGAAELFSAEVTISTSGVLGGEPKDGVDPGTVFVATCVEGSVTSRTHHFDGTSDEMLDAAVRQALYDLLSAVAEPQTASTGRTTP